MKADGWTIDSGGGTIAVPIAQDPYHALIGRTFWFKAQRCPVIAARLLQGTHHEKARG